MSKKEKFVFCKAPFSSIYVRPHVKVNKDYGITLLVIEHNMKVIMSLAQKIFCLAHGKMLAEGSPNQIKNDKRVVDAYLGAQ